MAANDECFEEWDADFLDEVFQAEERALSSANLSQMPKPQPPPATFTNAAASTSGRSFLPPPPPAVATNVADCYSPPRELSQRPSSSNGLFSAPDNAQELEIERLKKELERASKQLNGLEQECTELKRERDKQDKQLKSILLKAEAKKAEDKILKAETSCFRGSESVVLAGNHLEVSLQCQSTSTITEDAGQMKIKACQAIGVQTDQGGDLHAIDVKEDPCTNSFLQKNLQSIWLSSSGHRSRSFITKFLVTCTADFCDLFGYLSLNVSTGTGVSLERESINSTAPGSYINSFHSAQSISSVLTKIGDGLVQVDTLLEILLGLCNSDNVLVIHKSLCILHAALAILSTMERKHGRRENIKIEGLHAEQIDLGLNKSERQSFGAIYGIIQDATSKSSKKRIIDSTPLDSKGQWDCSNTLLSQVNFIHIFQKMCTIAMKSTYKQVQLEAVFIMNAILLRNNGFSEREGYGEPMVFEVVAHLLREKWDLSLQREAVRLLHLLLNCPKLLAKFCLSWQDLEKPAETTDGAKFTSQVSHSILQGLADCIVQYGNDAQGINLRKNTTLVLSFLASSGASGFEIVLFHKLSSGVPTEKKRSNDVNFLGLILRAVASDIDAEASESKPSLDILNERTLFMREALILLNRLASNPATSIAVLQVLTSNRDMASLSVDVAARLSRECRQLRTADRSMNVRQSEVTELARVFKKRVFSYLGESISL